MWVIQVQVQVQVQARAIEVHARRKILLVAVAGISIRHQASGISYKHKHNTCIPDRLLLYDWVSFRMKQLCTSAKLSKSIVSIAFDMSYVICHMSYMYMSCKLTCTSAHEVMEHGL